MIRFNATPLVDVIFLLTIFFMLVSRFSSAEQIPMQLPQPDESQAAVIRIPDRVLINCRLADPLSGSTDTAVYSIGPNHPISLGELGARLSAMKQKNANLKVVIRADKRLRFDSIRAVMRLLANESIEVLNVVAHVSEKGS